MSPILAILLLLVLVVFPLWAGYRILALGRDNESLKWRVAALEDKLGGKARPDDDGTKPAHAKIVFPSDKRTTPPPSPDSN